MSATEQKLNRIGVGIPEILLPQKDVDLTKWSVVACDQYTSQPDYWAQADSLVGSAPSTLKIIFPEVFLEREGKDERIAQITSAMRNYLSNGIVAPLTPGFVYVDRQTSHAASRKGLMVCLDLECYDYNAGSQTLIRATEGTVIDRLPPRIRIREGASLESPHIMVLIDDPERTVVEPLADEVDGMEKLYEFELMLDGGAIKGYKVDQPRQLSRIAEALETLGNPEVFRGKYGVGTDKGVLLFAVGDGNHSLATAKACWERIKAGLTVEEQAEHPARFALVEIVNVHDSGLQFEPIHRVIFGVDPSRFFSFIEDQGVKMGLDLKTHRFADGENIQTALAQLKTGKTQVIPFVAKNESGAIVVGHPRSNLEVGTLQSLLDAYVKTDPSAKIDYIHGDAVVNQLGAEPNNIGFCLPPMDKNDLFKTVILDGVLPRKTFSMGEAEEKRFYLECRKIVK